MNSKQPGLLISRPRHSAVHCPTARNFVRVHRTYTSSGSFSIVRYSKHDAVTFIIRTSHCKQWSKPICKIPTWKTSISYSVQSVVALRVIIFFYSGGWSPNWVHSARRPLTGLLYLPRVIVMMENLVEWMAGEAEVLGENLPRRHFVHDKSHLTRPGIEPGPPRWEASD
jgi:hypothetical protein